MLAAKLSAARCVGAGKPRSSADPSSLPEGVAGSLPPWKRTPPSTAAWAGAGWGVLNGHQRGHQKGPAGLRSDAQDPTWARCALLVEPAHFPAGGAPLALSSLCVLPFMAPAVSKAEA